MAVVLKEKKKKKKTKEKEKEKDDNTNNEATDTKNTNNPSHEESYLYLFGGRDEMQPTAEMYELNLGNKIIHSSRIVSHLRIPII